ncbi:uncharacterized protein LOC100141330 [Danio rerio]|uniref:Uncharacterized protein LOC100141330 n=1 Tax=Danio rerio TaxID=7955 RepID=A8KB42_DANRE|nr:uncharacterized protein LOC100141330 [Danio rerio]AAI53956.1 Zgc:171534 protein [Danio rerio]|eukprot:NP_001108367.1 uncharacterized protein LOC100141330 [Danio rerio]
MVPSHIWTAVCYKHRLDDEKSFSFSYLGENLPEGDITLMSVENLNSQLSVLNSYQTIQIFADNCFGNNNKLSKVQGEFQKLISLKVCKNQMNTKIQNICNNLGVIIPAINRKRTTSQLFDVSEMTVKLAFNSMSSYFTGVEELKTLHGSACLITRAKPLKKGDVSTDEVECMLVPEKQNTAADGSSCLYRSESDNVCRCYYEGGHKPCCSSSCLYQDELQDYRCYSGQELVRCSPRYSLITADGQRCKEDHPCATYGHGYYWCRTSAEETSPCSPPLWRSKAKNGKYCRSNHACAKYGQSEPWCYTDDEGNSDKCCTSDDCYSAVNGKTCRSDHECGYHGYSFLWCYTDDNNNWEYCCTDCDDGGNTDNTCVNTYASPFSNYAPAWM